MAKTNPIGVRFDKDLLNALEEDKIADSPQKALNFLTHFYATHNPDKPDFVKLFKDSRLGKAEEAAKVNLKDLSKTTDVKPVTSPKSRSNYTVDTIPKSVTVTVKDGVNFNFSKPERLPKESGIDYSIRLAEWKEKLKSKPPYDTSIDPIKVNIGDK